MDFIDDTGEDDHPELPPPRDVWLAERRVYGAAAHLRGLEGTSASSEAMRAALLDYRTAWLRFMVSLCNLPLAERPRAVEHVMESLREAHLLRPRGEREHLVRADAPPRPMDVPPGLSHE
jgi:hypothetical protein